MSEKRQRNRKIEFRVNDEEYARFQKLFAGLSPGDFFRQTHLGTMPLASKRNPSDNNKMLVMALGEWGRVGNNLNQIAHYLIHSDMNTKVKGEPILPKVKEIRSVVRSALHRKINASDVAVLITDWKNKGREINRITKQLNQGNPVNNELADYVTNILDQMYNQARQIFASHNHTIS